MAQRNAFSAEREAQRARHDTPAQGNPAKDFMQVKQELGGSPSASIPDNPTPIPKDRGSLSQPESTAFDLTGIPDITTSFEIPPEPTTSDFEGDTIADDDSLFGGDLDRVQDTGAALTEVNSEPAAVQHIDQKSELQTTAGAEANIRESPALQSVVDDAQAPLQQALPDDSLATDAEIEAAIAQVLHPEMEVADMHWSPLASPAEWIAMDYGTPCYGLYLTLTNPSIPAVTYRIQLNTTLGQAQSDMKLIVSTEVMKAQAQGDVEDLALDIDIRKIDMVHQNGTCLSYEIVQGTFTEGVFTSAMERDGKVVDGESYTRKMFEKAVRDTERMQASANEDVGDGPSNSAKDASPEQDALTTPLSQSPRANRIESQDKTPEQQTPTPVALYSPIKKRGRDVEDTPSLPSKKPRLSPAPPTQEPASKTSAAEPTDDDQPEKIFCRCKQPDDGTDMLGCDGDACVNGGWVHMHCFPEIESAPVADGGVSKWYCPDCDPAAFKKSDKKGKAVKKGVAVKKGGVEKKKSGGKKGRAANMRKFIR